MSNREDEEIIEDFLGENARASQLRELIEVLRTRLGFVESERDGLPPGDSGRSGLDRKVRELREQIAALAEEEAVSRFVEDSVRFTLARPEGSASAIDDDGGPY
jgi:hypothetical protein